MEKNTDTTVKVNRYTILDSEIKALAKAKKEKKAEMLKLQKDALEAYRKWVKETYKTERKAAFDKFAASKVVGTKPKTEKVTVAKKTAKKTAKKAKAKVEPKTESAPEPAATAAVEA